MSVQESAVGAFFVFEKVSVTDFLNGRMLTAGQFVIDDDRAFS